MTELHDPEIPQTKLLAGGAIKVRVALASALVLVVGAWLTPRAAQPALSAPPESPAPLLEQQVQQREAARPFLGVQDVAASVKAHSTTIALPPHPALLSRRDYPGPGAPDPAAVGFGVFVSDTHVLAHAAALDGRSSVLLRHEPDRAVEAKVVSFEPATGLVLLESEPFVTPPLRFPTGAPAAGALAVGVGRWAGRDVAVPVFVTAAGDGGFTIAGADEAVLPGMPIFTLDGELLAIAAPEGDRMHAVSAAGAAERLLAAAASAQPASIGIAVQTPDGLLARAFGERGVIVTDVLAGGPADFAGVLAGDVLLAVGDVEVDSVEAAMQALGAGSVGTPTPLRIRRAGRTRELDVIPVPAYEILALTRAGGARPAGLEARVLLPRQQLEQAAIPPAAHVLAVNFQPVASRAQLERELRVARGPVPILLALGEDRFFVAIEPLR